LGRHRWWPGRIASDPALDAGSVEFRPHALGGLAPLVGFGLDEVYPGLLVSEQGTEFEYFGAQSLDLLGCVELSLVQGRGVDPSLDAFEDVPSHMSICFILVGFEL
jgi:hypothetical protein